MGNNKPIVWSDEDKAKLRELIESGRSLREIAKIFNVEKTSIGKYAKKFGYTVKPRKVEIDGNVAYEDHLKHQISFWKKRAAALEKVLNNRNWLIESCRDSLSVLEPPEPYILKDFKDRTSEQELVALLSDCHAFERIESDETNVFDYNFDIFKTRFQLWLDSIARITDIHRKSFPIKTLNLFGLGDYLEGQNIFFGQGARLDDNIVKQFFGMTDVVCNGLSYLSKLFENINVTWLSGNHGRVFLKGQDKWYVNWEYTMGRFIQEKMRLHNNIEIDVPMSWWTIKNVMGWKFYLTHGDELVRYMGVPWYALERMDNRTTRMLQAIGKEYQYMIIGHHHESFSWDAPVGERICNGTFSYGNPFALKKLRTMSRPSQTLFGVHPQWGITFKYILRLDQENAKEYVCKYG